MYQLKEKKWSNGAITYHVIDTELPGYENQVPFKIYSSLSYFEQAKAIVDSMNKTVVSEKIIYP